MITKGVVTRAGETLVNNSSSEEARIVAREVLTTWRACHDAPLREMLSILEGIAETIPGALTVGRLKRSQSIVEKLRRKEHRFDLKTLNDIAGCRIVVPTCDEVEKVRALLHSEATYSKSEKDYLSTPKADGYRGVHTFHRCDSEFAELGKLRVEVQIRSALQHAWATAVESYDVITQAGLKSNGGTYWERRFFALASSLMAKQEGTSPVPELNKSIAELQGELRVLEDELKISSKLRGYLNSVSTIKEDEIFDGCAFFLIRFDDAIQAIVIKGYYPDQLDMANEEYSALEEIMWNDGFALLVSTSSIEKIDELYPNYFASISPFLSWIERHLV